MILRLIPLLVLVMFCFYACASAEALSDELRTCGLYEYRLLPDGTAELVRCHSAPQRLVLPEELDGYPVTAIGPNLFAVRTDVVSITIPLSVTDIPSNPLRMCSRLTTLIVPPEHPTLTVTDGALISTVDQRLICYPRGLTQEAYTVPHGVRAIGDAAFYWSLLDRVEFPESVTSIGAEAFSFSLNLREVTLPKAIVSIGDKAFSQCGSLLQIDLPGSLTHVGVNPFVSCSKLVDISVPASHQRLSISDHALIDRVDQRLISYPPGLTEVSCVVPEGVRVIGDCAFESCLELTRVSLPESLTVIGRDAFYDCQKLSAIRIPDAVTTLEDWAFGGCQNLTNMHLSESLTSIGSYAFENCRKLARLTLPEGLRVIGRDAFFSCLSLTSINLPAKLTEIGEQAFHSCHAVTLGVKKGSLAEAYCRQEKLRYRIN